MLDGGGGGVLRNWFGDIRWGHPRWIAVPFEGKLPEKQGIAGFMPAMP